MKAFYADTRLWHDAIDLAIGERGIDPNGNVGRGRLTHIAALTLTPHHEHDCIAEPTMRLSPAEARELMDELWRVGVRPSNGEGNLGQLGATEKHLEDMRRLVFKSEA